MVKWSFAYKLQHVTGLYALLHLCMV